MATKVKVLLLTLVLLFYAGLLATKALALLRSGSPLAVLLGAALVVLPVAGVYVVTRELDFGRRTARLGEELAAEGGLPLDDLPRRASGRVDRDAADARFEQVRAETEAAPRDWRAWYRLALAYDAAGDRTRARAAARRALTLHGSGR